MSSGREGQLLNLLGPHKQSREMLVKGWAEGMPCLRAKGGMMVKGCQMVPLAST